MKKQYSIYFTDEMKDKIRTKSKELGLTMNTIITMALIEYLDE